MAASFNNKACFMNLNFLIPEAPIELDAGISDVNFGADVKIVRPVNLYRCDIGDQVVIGPFVEIQQNVKVGKRTQIQSHSFVCEHVSIGNDCFISHGVMFTNDLLKAGKPDDSPENKKSTVIEDNVTIGSNATILPVRICSGTVIGAGTVVTRDISVPGTYAGNPARLLRKFDL
ncbi:N-acetyltransferase [Endozoicomonas sp. Mp262]|uniref:acyltransferase n=1 Tax=Endozoicomonas sp. Mp262 TaxID=2919499 RepID=UPI0021D7D2C3